VSTYVESSIFEQDSYWISVMREAGFIRSSYDLPDVTEIGAIGNTWATSELWRKHSDQGKLKSMTIAPTKPNVGESLKYHVIPKGHDPEPVLVFFDWAYSNPENYDLVSLGIEGEHYTQIDSDHRAEWSKIKLSDGNIIPFAGFTHQIPLDRPRGRVRETDFEFLAELDRIENAVVLPSHGFLFDLEPVREQYDAVLELLQTGDYTQILNGYLPFTERDRVVSELREVGLDEVLEECRRQLGEYREMTGR